MTDDPVLELRSQLVSAAARRIPASARHRRLPRRGLAFAAAAIIVPASVAAATGLLGSENHGSLPDGSVYQISDQIERPAGTLSIDDDGRVCTVTQFMREGRVSTTTKSCGPVNGRQSDRPLSVGYMAAPGNTTLASGTLSRQVAKLELVGASQAPTFSRQHGSDRRFFAAVFPADRPILIVARRADGTEIDRFGGSGDDRR